MDKKQQKLLFASACLGMLLFGITLTTLGAILPEIIQRFKISKTDAGSLFTVMNFGILLGSLVFGPVVDRFGYKTLLVVCSALLFIGMEGVAFSYSFELFTLFVWIFGFSGGVINGAANALVSDISVEGRGAGLALLGVFFGVGAFGMPLILGSGVVYIYANCSVARRYNRSRFHNVFVASVSGTEAASQFSGKRGAIAPQTSDTDSVGVYTLFPKRY